MSEITITDDRIEVRFTRLEQLAGLVRDQSIPRAAITDVQLVPDGIRGASGWRAPGLGVPRTRKLGTWRRRGGKVLVDVRRGEPAVRIGLRGERYDALLLAVPDAPAVAQALTSRGAAPR